MSDYMTAVAGLDIGAGASLFLKESPILLKILFIISVFSSICIFGHFFLVLCIRHKMSRVCTYTAGCPMYPGMTGNRAERWPGHEHGHTHDVDGRLHDVDGVINHHPVRREKHRQDRSHFNRKIEKCTKMYLGWLVELCPSGGTLSGLDRLLVISWLVLSLQTCVFHFSPQKSAPGQQLLAKTGCWSAEITSRTDKTSQVATTAHLVLEGL